MSELVHVSYHFCYIDRRTGGEDRGFCDTVVPIARWPMCPGDVEPIRQYLWSRLEGQLGADARVAEVTLLGLTRLASEPRGDGEM